jgi:hypothetical protein
MREPPLRKTWEYSNIANTSLISYERGWPLACLDGLIKPNQASHQGARWTSSVSMLKVPVLALIIETSAVWTWWRRSFQDICRGLWIIIAELTTCKLTTTHQTAPHVLPLSVTIMIYDFIQNKIENWNWNVCGALSVGLNEDRCTTVYNPISYSELELTRCWNRCLPVITLTWSDSHVHSPDMVHSGIPTKV